MPGKTAQAARTLGWDSGLLTYRPFRSYRKLGGLLESARHACDEAVDPILVSGSIAITKEQKTQRNDGY